MESTPLQGHIGVLGQSRLFGFVVLLTGTMTVLNRGGFEIETGYLSEAKIGLAGTPINLKVKLRQWIISHDLRILWFVMKLLIQGSHWIF